MASEISFCGDVASFGMICALLFLTLSFWLSSSIFLSLG